MGHCRSALRAEAINRSLAFAFHTTCSVDQTNRFLPTTAPPRKRPHALALAVYDPTEGEQRAKRQPPANLSVGAGALVSVAAPAVDVEPINGVPLVGVAPPPQGAAGRAEPWWVRKQLLPHLRLRSDLPVHFIDEKAVTNTDLSAHQNRFRLPNDGVLRHLLPILSPEEIKAANLVDPKPRQPPPTDGERGTRKKRKGRKHGGLPVLVVNDGAGIKELQLSRWESNRGTIIKGEGYLDFINQCSFKENDVVEIWAFKQRAFRYFGVTMCAESLLYVLITKKEQQPALPPAPPVLPH